MNNPILITVSNVFYAGSIVRWIGTDKQGKLQHINWDQRQHGAFVEDHQDLTIPFDVFFEDTDNGPSIQLVQ
jgi:hypothetical protein